MDNRIYHLIVRGNNKNAIFIHDSDKNKYKYLLKKYKGKYGFLLRGYVIMDNHAHILIEEKSTKVSKVMQSIQISYSKYYNTKYKKTGHVFEKRYKKLICITRENFLQLIKYIHRNPEKIGINIEDYIWSSHHEYINNYYYVVDKELLINELSTSSDSYINEYKKLMTY